MCFYPADLVSIYWNLPQVCSCVLLKWKFFPNIDTEATRALNQLFRTKSLPNSKIQPHGNSSCDCPLRFPGLRHIPVNHNDEFSVWHLREVVPPVPSQWFLLAPRKHCVMINSVSVKLAASFRSHFPVEICNSGFQREREMTESVLSWIPCTQASSFKRPQDMHRA